MFAKLTSMKLLYALALRGGSLLSSFIIFREIPHIGHLHPSQSCVYADFR
jgi:hypothetical protein